MAAVNAIEFLGAKLDALDAKLDAHAAALDAKLDAQLAAQSALFDSMLAELASVRRMLWLLLTMTTVLLGLVILLYCVRPAP